jgi:hypothetical protein
MSNWLIIFVAFIYVYIGVGYLIENKMGLGITFIAYALANLGLYIEAKY